MSPTPGIMFRIDPASVACILTWTDEIEWQYVAGKISRYGNCLVNRKNRATGQTEMVDLREMPSERGMYAPLLGMVGGELTYTFHPTANGVNLNVFAGHKIPGSDDYPTFDFELEHQIETNGFGILFVNDALFKDGDNFFGFTGEFFSIFRAWNHYSENAENFEFEFQPLSIGCEVGVIHVESGERIHLTADVDW